MDEARIIQIGNIISPNEKTGYKNSQKERVYDINGLCPALNGLDGGDNKPKILVEDERLQDNRLQQAAE